MEVRAFKWLQATYHLRDTQSCWRGPVQYLASWAGWLAQARGYDVPWGFWVESAFCPTHSQHLLEKVRGPLKLWGPNEPV